VSDDPTSKPVVIVGAGPCGLAAAAALKQGGIPAVVFDSGCVASSIAGYPTYVTFFSTAERIAVAGLPFPLAGEKPTRRDALAYYRMVVKHFGLDVRQYEPVEAIERTADGFVVTSRPHGGKAWQTPARAVVIATGYFGTPNALGVPGEKLPHVTHSFLEGHYAFQRTALVVGGGNSAVEVSLDLYRAGAHVTMVHFGPTFDKNIKPWVLPDFEGRVKDGDIKVLWNTRVTRIETDVAHLATPDGEVALPAQHVYLATGYTPHPGLLSSLSVPVDPRTGVPAHDPVTMETPTKGVFIAGVLASGYDANKIFIENGRGHGALIAGALLQQNHGLHGIKPG
jgi:thioredoxin reductase (NADPH)